jgi:hypothetical protein
VQGGNWFVIDDSDRSLQTASTDEDGLVMTSQEKELDRFLRRMLTSVIE